MEESIQKGIQEGLQGLEVDLSACRNHHKDLAAFKQSEKQMKDRIDTLEKENKQLSDKLNNLEHYTRRNNVKILGVRETNGENCKDAIIAILAHAGISLAPGDIATAHRIHSSTAPCPIIIQFIYPDQKQLVLRSRAKIKQASKATVVDDVPDEMREARRILFPIMFKAKAELGDARARIRGNKLILNGKPYGVDDLDSLPPQLHPSEVFTRSTDDSIAFFTKMSPFSNHFLSNFRIEGIEFNCSEQFFMYSKAILFNDQHQAENILKATDPVTQKRLGSQITGFKKDVWYKKSRSVMETGLMAKFNQNSTLKNILLSTNSKSLIEANKNDKYWSCGIDLFDNKVWDKKNWQGKNALGELLMTVRDRIK